MENVLETIRNEVKNWWLFILSGLLFIATGIAIYARPAEGYLSLSILFSLVIISSGITQIFFSTANSDVLKGWGWILVSGILDLAIGSFLLLYPGLTMITLPYFVGFWLVFRAFNLMGTSFDLKNFGVTGWGWLLFGGIVVLALGFLIIYHPAAGIVSIIAVSGSAFIIGGFLNIYIAFQLKNLKSGIDQVKESVDKFKGKYRPA